MKLAAAAALLALTVAACDSEHPAVAEVTDYGRFGPARLVSLPTEYRDDREAYLAVGRKLCPDGQICHVIFFPRGADVSIPPSGDLIARRDGEYAMNPLTSQVNLTLRCDIAAADPGNCL